MTTCFVVQGYGKKVDFATGRTLDLDKSYEVIKEAVESAGLQCIRADEIVNSGTIDVPMYEWLLRADVVVADLSTANVNAAYELGVRYALRPRTTVILAESEFKNPFDLNHIVIRPYKHLGEDLGAHEARRLKTELADTIRALLANGQTDSPVYTYLALEPPREAARMSAVVAAPAPETGEGDANARELLVSARAAMEKSDFATARVLFGLIRQARPNDEYVVQQLALATYKSRQPDVRQALVDARELLKTLQPATTNDPETLGLWGAVHKRFWEVDGDREALDTAIAAYERGLYLKQDYYTGINLAYLLNVRAALAKQAGDVPNAITDFVVARRVRREVVGYCEHAMGTPNLDPVTRYWIVATLWEAAVGLEDDAASARWRAEAAQADAAAWMRQATSEQLERLQKLIADSPLHT